MNIHRSFTNDFKIAAVKRCEHESLPTVCRDLGIVRSVIDRWRRQVTAGEILPDKPVDGTSPNVTLAVVTTAPKALAANDLRVEAIRLVKEKGGKAKDVAAKLNVKVSRVYSWLTKHNAEEKVRARQNPPPQPVTILNFCPHCGMPLAAVNRALNAIAAINHR